MNSPATNSGTGSGPLATVNRLARAVNDHDLDALAACFAEDYVNETPAHPLRGFTGRSQVRANWAQIFAGVPDIRSAVLDTVIDGERVWTEWSMAGTRRDGSAHEMAGISVFTVSGDEITAARFYLEPVERGSGTVDDAVGRQVVGASTP